MVRDDEPALWALSRTTPAPTAATKTAAASSRACASRSTARAASAPTSARTPGPKEDRLRLTRATQANLSPIFSLYADPRGRAWAALEPHTAASRAARPPTTTAPTTASGGSPTPTRSRAVQEALADAELLIADGHHRYETARVYADEIGGEGDHRYVLMCLVALEDPGLTVFPTHRLLDGPRRPRPQETLGARAPRALRHRGASTHGRAAPARRATAR